MVLIEPTTSAGLAIYLLVGVALIYYSGLGKKISTGLGYLVAASVFFLLDAATGIGFWGMSSLVKVQGALSAIWQIIAWILILIAAFMITSELAKMGK